MIQNFFVQNLWIFLLGQSVCQTRLEKLDKDKHSSLIRKSANHGKKSFITLGPGVAVKYYTRHKMLDRDKRSSLLDSMINVAE